MEITTVLNKTTIMVEVIMSAASSVDELWVFENCDTNFACQ